MKITDNVYLIRKDFYVTPEVKRYINIYLITGENCYLRDSGVAGSEKLIEEYLHSIGRKPIENCKKQMHRLKCVGKSATIVSEHTFGSAFGIAFGSTCGIESNIFRHFPVFRQRKRGGRQCQTEPILQSI